MQDDFDNLTGCKSRARLDFQIEFDLRNSQAERYQETFLCCDLDHLADHLEIHGHHGGDTAIVGLAERLRGLHEEVYRFGGDEFVVKGIKEPIQNLNTDLIVPARQCIVAVDLPIDRDRSFRAKSWVLAHLQMAIVQPKFINDTIRCVAPPDWAG